jgi:hypothetical protein
VGVRVRCFRVSGGLSKWGVKIVQRPVGSVPCVRCLTCSLAYSGAQAQPNGPTELASYAAGKQSEMGVWASNQNQTARPETRNEAGANPRNITKNITNNYPAQCKVGQRRID